MSRPNALTGGAVVRAAVRLADERGIDAVTMRALGAQVGVGAMALYHYVSGREALLDAMIADQLQRLDPQLKLDAVPRISGVAYLERTARAVRRVALAHPWLVRLMVARPPLDPNLNATLAAPAALACTESVLSALAGHTGPDTKPAPDDGTDGIRTLRAFVAFLLGHLLLEIPVPAVRTDPRTPDRPPPLSTTRRAQLLTQLTPLMNAEPAAEFDRALHAFLSTLFRWSTREPRGTDAHQPTESGAVVPSSVDVPRSHHEQGARHD